jgi:hypothetical protein
MKKATCVNDIITTIAVPCWMLLVTSRDEHFTVHMSQSLSENIQICGHLTEDKNVDSCKIPGTTRWTRFLQHRYLAVKGSLYFSKTTDDVLQSKSNIKFGSSIDCGNCAGVDVVVVAHAQLAQNQNCCFSRNRNISIF